ncbi:Mov34/MPN/PAD-1 family protein [Desulfocurvibacter africanus]|uniref:Mov34/MPN/PAD-1 family protein n=1 Tax=Desulfocurvibacter africanus TaxID=873 RepID=UPI003CC7FAA2
MRQESRIAWLPRKLLGDMRALAQELSPKETGGVLMGYRSQGQIVITEVVGPGPGAEHFPSRFVPDHEWQETEVARIYKASGRMHTYLGDWHSHPFGGCRPSRRDIYTLWKISREEEARAPWPIMTILSGEEWEADVWLLGTRRIGRWLPIPSLEVMSVHIHSD